MHEMFHDYFQTEYGREVIQNEFGFITYYLNPDNIECLVADLYTKPEFRKTFEAKKLFTQVVNIAKEKGYSFVTANIACKKGDPNKATKLAKCYLSLGFKIAGANYDNVLLMMDIREAQA